MDNKSTVAVLIIGGAHTGKSTVQSIITNALRAAGIEPVLGENAQHELKMICQEGGGFLEEATEKVVEHSVVMVEEIHAPAFNAFVQNDPRPVVSFRGYAHSAGFKIIPVYKDKS